MKCVYVDVHTFIDDLHFRLWNVKKLEYDVDDKAECS